jgi:hypothetical protein
MVAALELCAQSIVINIVRNHNRPHPAIRTSLLSKVELASIFRNYMVRVETTGFNGFDSKKSGNGKALAH